MRDYDDVAYPSSRRLTFDFGKIGLAKHHVKAFLPVDVTEARSRIRAARRSGKHISFFAWLIKLTADCVARHPEVNAYNRPSQNTIVHFRDVDVSIADEKEVDGTPVPLPYVVRQANSKALNAIAAEIEAAKSQKVQDEGQYVLGKGDRTVRCAPALPCIWIAEPGSGRLQGRHAAGDSASHRAGRSRRRG